MIQSRSFSARVFLTANFLFLTLLALLCVLPIFHIFVLSFSSQSYVSAGEVTFWPKGFTLYSYQFVLEKPEFFRSMGITIQRVLLGTVVNMLLTLLVAYPLAKEKSTFQFRTFYAWYFVVTILFSGGLIPWYLTVKETGLLDSIWALVLPGAVPVFNVILLLNFFRGLPKALDESARIDGAGHWHILWRIYAPLSLPAIATIILFTIVGHWNAWFDGLILMNHPDRYPLSSYLQTVIVSPDLTKMSDLQQRGSEALLFINDRTVKASQIFIGMLPVLMIYPFLQRFFMSGIVLGSVKE